MATVVRNPDNSITVTLTPMEQRVMVRWAQEYGRPAPALLQDVLENAIGTKRGEYRAIDGPVLYDKREALTPTVQAQVDALLG